jgi:hypothetical protein
MLNTSRPVLEGESNKKLKIYWCDFHGLFSKNPSTLLVGRKLSKNLSRQHCVFLTVDLSIFLDIVLNYANRNFRHYSGSRVLYFQSTEFINQRL